MIAAGALPIPGDLAARVTDESYYALLGYPVDELPTGRGSELARESRKWFETRARPWAFSRPLGIARATGDGVTLESGRTFTSARLAERLREIEADLLVAAAVSAGPEIDAQSTEWWQEDKPDQAYFLDRFGAAAAVHLAAWVGEHLRGAARAGGLGLGSGYSPGYDGWELADQVELAACLAADGPGSPPAALRVHESGMIEPKSSLLAVFGVGRRQAAAELQWSRHRCSWCSLAGCGLRGRP